MRSFLLFALTTLFLMGSFLFGCEEDDDDDENGGGENLSCAEITGSPREMDEAKLYFEFQSTDDDTGIHGLLGGVDWAEMCVTDPNGESFLVAKPRGNLQTFGLSDIFFESREPPSTVMSQQEIIAQFPAGEWTINGTTFDGASYIGTAWLTHNIPTPPVITAPDDEVTIDPDNFSVAWEPVTQTVSGDPLTITGYEIIVTNEDKDGADPHGMSHPILSVHVVPSVNEISIPPEFFEPATTYELEVIAIEESGNQTITVQFFETP